MRYLNVRTFSKNLHQELLSLPVTLTKYGKPFAVISEVDTPAMIVPTGEVSGRVPKSEKKETAKKEEFQRLKSKFNPVPK